MKKSLTMVQVRNFMKGAGQTVRENPAIPTREELRVRCTLQLEEALELCEACGYDVGSLGFFSVDDDDRVSPGEAAKIAMQVMADAPLVGPPHLVRIIDGAADSIVIAVGTFAACGVDDIGVLDEVMKNNLGKLVCGKLEDGKFRKPADYPPPDIAGVIRRQVRSDNDETVTFQQDFLTEFLPETKGPIDVAQQEELTVQMDGEFPLALGRKFEITNEPTTGPINTSALEDGQ